MKNIKNNSVSISSSEQMLNIKFSIIKFTMNPSIHPIKNLICVVRWDCVFDTHLRDVLLKWWCCWNLKNAPHCRFYCWISSAVYLYTLTKNRTWCARYISNVSILAKIKQNNIDQHFWHWSWCVLTCCTFRALWNKELFSSFSLFVLCPEIWRACVILRVIHYSDLVFVINAKNDVKTLETNYKTSFSWTRDRSIA